MSRLLLRLLPFALIFLAAPPPSGQAQTDPKAAAARAQAASREAAKAAAVARAKAAAQAESRAKAAEATAVRSGIYRSVDQVLQAAGGDAKRFEETLLAGQVQTSLERVCAIASERVVVCTSIDDLARGMRLAPADDKYMRLGLNELMRANGFPESHQTLYLCMQQGPVIGREQMGSLPGTGPTTPLGRQARPRAFAQVQHAGRTAGTAASAAAADRDALAQRCSSGLRSSPRFRPVRGGGAGSGYRGAVASAVGYMDQATSQCHRSGTSPVAQQSAPGAPSGPAGGGGGSDGTWGQTAVKVTIGTGEFLMGAGEVAVAVAKGNLPEAFLAGTSAALGAASDLNEESLALGTASDAASGLGLIATAVTAGAGTVAAAGALTVGSAVVGTATLAWNLGRAIDKVTGVGDYLVNVAVEAQERRDSVTRAREAEQARLESTEGTPDSLSGGTPDSTDGAAPDSGNGGTPDTTNGGTDAQDPGPDGGDGMSCEEMQQAWARFKAYCSQPGNDWRTYDCAKFVARMNGCADPAVVNPGPEGDYACRGRATERDKAIYMCEQRQKQQDMIARPAGDGRRKSCAEQVAFWSNARVMVQEIAMERQCTKADPGEEGVCAAAPSTGGGAPAPRPKPLGR